MIQFITHTNDRYDYVEGARLAMAGGCRWIQLRMKDAPKDTFMAAATAIGQLCKTYHATFILDDHAEWVQEAGADGVHLGKNDMPVSEARKLLGSRYVIGGTANTFDDVERLYRDGADYIGCGPFRFTTTKQKLSPILGADGYRRIVSQMKLHHITIPIVAIGGILSSDILDVMATGVSGIAVSGAILNADSPVEEMQRFIRLTEKEIAK